MPYVARHDISARCIGQCSTLLCDRRVISRRVTLVSGIMVLAIGKLHDMTKPSCHAQCERQLLLLEARWSCRHSSVRPRGRVALPHGVHHSLHDAAPSRRCSYCATAMTSTMHCCKVYIHHAIRPQLACRTLLHSTCLVRWCTGVACAAIDTSAMAIVASLFKDSPWFGSVMGVTESTMALGCVRRRIQWKPLPQSDSVQALGRPDLACALSI